MTWLCFRRGGLLIERGVKETGGKEQKKKVSTKNYRITQVQGGECARVRRKGKGKEEE